MEKKELDRSLGRIPLVPLIIVLIVVFVMSGLVYGMLYNRKDSVSKMDRFKIEYVNREFGFIIISHANGKNISKSRLPDRAHIKGYPVKILQLNDSVLCIIPQNNNLTQFSNKKTIIFDEY
ncbi:hypothetical protein [Sphingobacterium siyangense]|uniref:hypothetical protein n=1 Tax=Sphingobacterium siyangense TaxID=459529 RepID=UPI002FD9FC9F